MIWELLTAILVTSRGFWKLVGVAVVLGGIATVAEQGNGEMLWIALPILALGLWVGRQRHA